MVRSIIVFLLVFLLGGVAGAAVLYRCRGAEQPAWHGPMPVERRVAVLTMRLGLRDDQRAKVEELMADHHRRFATRAHALLDADPELEAARAQMFEQLRAILDDEQRERLDELPRGGGGPLGHGPFGGGPPLGHGPPWMHEPR